MIVLVVHTQVNAAAYSLWFNPLVDFYDINERRGKGLLLGQTHQHYITSITNKKNGEETSEH